jgi:hypothetical protein
MKNMKLKILLGLMLTLNSAFGQNQQIKRLDGTKISVVEIDETVKRLNGQGKCSRFEFVNTQ